jgi:ParB-like chromosome segregation protein Spo0J
MNVETVDITTLHHPKRNVRVHPKKQIEELARSIKQFGQFRPAVVDEGGVILVGNGMVAAMRLLDLKEVAVHRMTGLTQAKKTKLMMADNKIYSLGFDDHNAIMESIGELNLDFDIPGFDDDVLKKLTSSVSADVGLTLFGVLSPADVEKAKGEAFAEGSTQPDAPAGLAQPPAGQQPKPAETAAEICCPNCQHKFKVAK